MAKKRVELTLGLDKNLLDPAGDTTDLVIRKRQDVEFRINFKGPELLLSLVCEGVYTPIFSSTLHSYPDTPFGIGRIVMQLDPGVYTLDFNTWNLSDLTVRIIK